MGRPCGAKNLKNRTSDLKKTHFQKFVPSLADPGEHRTSFYMGAQLHFFRFTKA